MTSNNTLMMDRALGALLGLACGDGRTGTVVACWLGREVASLDEAMIRLHEARAGTRKAHRACPETHSQWELLERPFARTHEQ